MLAGPVLSVDVRNLRSQLDIEPRYLISVGGLLLCSCEAP